MVSLGISAALDMLITASLEGQETTAATEATVEIINWLLEIDSLAIQLSIALVKSSLNLPMAILPIKPLPAWA